MNAIKNFYQAHVNKLGRTLMLTMFCFIATSMFAQKVTITGNVQDEMGESLIGASIKEIGTTNGTVTDLDGNFSLSVDASATLEFSYIGFLPQEEKVNGRTTINVVMKEDSQQLDEVVVVGYGTMRKSDVTGSIAIAKGSDMVKGQNFSALDNLRGKASGVNIFSNSSQPGAYGNRVVIRGNSTINSSSNPLYVVDGVVMSDFHLINPNDIESIEVLKDASAAAIYGARGANGIILVTTKRGVKGEAGTVVSYQGSMSISSAARYMDVMNSQEWTDAFMIGLENENKYQGKNWSLDRTQWFTDKNYFDANGNPLYNTDWQREATRTAISHNHQLNIQQGGKNSSMGAFINYSDQQGIVNNTYSKRLNGKLAYDAKPLSWLSTSVNLMVNHVWSRYTPETGGGQDARRTMVEMLPWMTVYDQNGNYTTSTSTSMGEGYGFEGMSNPVMILDLQKRMLYNTKIFGNAALTFHLMDGLDLKTQFGLDNTGQKYREYSSVELNNISKPNGRAERWHKNTLYWQEETYLTYNKVLEKHRINAMAGLSWTQTTYDYDRLRTEGFADDLLEDFAMENGTKPSAPETDWNQHSMNSYFVRLAYTYNDRYSATVTGRADGSSKFGKNNKYGFFPSAGLAWNAINEDFMANQTTFSNLKLHTSYGITGNSEIDPYRPLSRIESGTHLLNGIRSPWSYIGNIANPELKWEKTAQWDIGIDLGLFKNRLMLDVAFYTKKTTDLLLDTPIPHSTGFNSVFRNIGSVRNQGLDIMVNATPVRTNDFEWNATLNMNYNKNEVLKLGDNNADILQHSWVGGPGSVIRVGENMNSFYGYRRYGVFTKEDYEAGKCELKQIGRPNRSAEKEILGKGTPDWTGSFSNNFRYKNFDLTVDMQFVLGVETMQQFYHSMYDRFGITNGLKEILYDAYDGTNPYTMQQAIYLQNDGHAGQDSSVDSSWVVDGSYLRCNMLQLGYTFTPNVCKSLGISALRLYGSANNLFLITSSDFKGYDPESTSQGDGDKFGQNMTFFSYPRARTFTFGVNLTF